jgi:hypothetical protein
MTQHTGIVGSGLIGRSWAIVFARGGLPRLFVRECIRRVDCLQVDGRSWGSVALCFHDDVDIRVPLATHRERPHDMEVIFNADEWHAISDAKP